MSFLNLRRSKQDSSRSPQQRLSLNLFFDQHYFPHAKVSKAQSHHDWSIFNTHIRANIGHYMLDELTNPVLDVWVRQQIVAGYQRSTINKHIHLMNRMLNLARHWGHIAPFNPNQSHIKALLLGDFKQRFLTEDEIARLLDACDRSTHPFLRLFTQLLLLTGARKGEALGARWRDIDTERRVWTVPKSKNGRSRRIVLNNMALEVIEAIRCTASKLGSSTKPDSHILINPRTRKPYDSFYAAWYVARDAAGLDDLRIHDLRHTFASLLINKGVSLYEVQTLLGHRSMQMTQRYAHLAPDRLHMRAELVADIVRDSGR